MGIKDIEFISDANPYQRLGIRKFNVKLMARITGIMLLYLAASLILPLALSIYYGDGEQFDLLLSMTAILIVGLFLRNMVGRRPEYDLQENESYWVTIIIWLAIPICGAIPYLFTGSISSVTDALFESYSGFTTTGSSILAAPQDLPTSILAYRAFTQWVGGLGLMLFVVAILRKLTFGARELYEAEFSGTQERKLHPRISKSVTRLWTIYTILTVLLFILLMIQGTSPIDSFCLACSTVSTGGFTTHTDGLAILNNNSLVVIVIFMFFSGINVALLYRLFTLKLRHIGRDEELRTYLTLFTIGVIICTVAFFSSGNPIDTSVRYSIFHIASTMSTCGFFLPKPAHWSFLVSTLTFVLIILGASAGSTGGGIKLRRIIILHKYIYNYFTRMLHPNAVFKVKVNGQVVEQDYITKIFAYVFLYIAFIIGGAFILTLCDSSIPNAVCMSAANISNLGPSPLINNLGGNLDYAMLPNCAKWTLTLLMLAGRLELFALIAVCSPAYWKRGKR